MACWGVGCSFAGVLCCGCCVVVCEVVVKLWLLFRGAYTTHVHWEEAALAHERVLDHLLNASHGLGRRRHLGRHMGVNVNE